MFDIGFGEFVVLGALALFVFGPEKLPKAISDLAGLLRQLRGMAQGAKAEITSAIEPSMQGLDISDLNPKTFVQRTFMEDAPAAVPRSPAVLPKGASAPWDPDTT
ncbi:MAG: twin-arginine translocase TatA/TatE family subunit [Actinomycetes bacterium]|jgi:sec-independent protein translocase protein TatB